jgi:phosphatidylglycerophosphatase A
MNPRTERNPDATASATPVPVPTAAQPRLAYLIATVFGAGYLPVAPGTFGSLVGLVIYAAVSFGIPIKAFALAAATSPGVLAGGRALRVSLTCVAIAAALAFVGVWAANRVVAFSGKKDPGFVVIDETSGQFLALFLALAPVNWKYLLLGFILFRVFDIWKPFPVRQAESLRAGWGIMADDWIAGIYAALGLWLARAAGL